MANDSDPPFVFRNNHERALWRGVFIATQDKPFEAADAAVLTMRERDLTPTSARDIDIRDTLRVARETLGAIYLAAVEWRKAGERASR